MRGEIVLTDKCNFHCPYCRGQRKDLSRPLSRLEAINIVGLLSNQKLKNIRFSGGEPTCWEGLPELAKYARSVGIERVAVSTNGSADLDYYKRLIANGVNDLSISLDACCAQVGDKMAGVQDSWEHVIHNILHLSKLVYLTIGIVVVPQTASQLCDTIELADLLGVSDIRIIPAAQHKEILPVVDRVSPRIVEKYPILRYRLANIASGVRFRGIGEDNTPYCWVSMDDVAIAGDYHYPCIIYLREQGEPIGRVGPDMRRQRQTWVMKHDAKKDPICRENCLDCIVQYNNEFERIRKVERQACGD